jgi:1-phosphofructokinase
MITTLTPNPSLDRTVSVDRLVRGELTRVRRTTLEPAGKGINVAKALHANGYDVHAVVPAGGADGIELLRLLALTGVSHTAVPISNAVRSNISVVEDDGTLTKLNEPGPALTAAELEALVTTAIDVTAPDEWLVASGSLAPGSPSDFYASLARRGTTSGIHIAIDSSGSALANAIAGRPDLIKPNRDELRGVAKGPLRTLGDVVSECQRLVELGVGAVLASLGPDGAVVVSREAIVHGRVDIGEVRNTVGAGDTLLAGYLAEPGDPVLSLTRALAWARAAVRSPLTAMAPPNDADFDAVTIHEDPALDMALSEEMVDA